MLIHTYQKHIHDATWLYQCINSGLGHRDIGPEVNQIMEELDANGDGEIDFQEFMAMMSNQDLQRDDGSLR